MGNRGILHDDHQRVGRKFALKRWIVCLLEFKGRRRVVQQPGNYTELFFLDEATAFAAGHRPCFECRRPDAKQFLSRSGFRSCPELDAQLHFERLGVREMVEDWDSLPDGAFVSLGDVAYLAWGGRLFRWSFDGYELADLDSALGEFEVLTPPTTLGVLRSGYRVQVHRSAG